METARMRTSLTLFVALTFCCLANGQSTSRAPQLRPIQQDGKWGYIDGTGKIAVKPQFAWAEEFSEGLAAFENEHGKHGYIDETGRVVIEPKFDNWTEFSEGLAAVSVDFEWGYIDKTPLDSVVLISISRLSAAFLLIGRLPRLSRDVMIVSRKCNKAPKHVSESPE